MKNKTFQMAAISRNKNSLLVNNGGRKRLTKQAGSVNKLLLIMVMVGLGYSAFVAKNKGLISIGTAQNFVSKLSDKVSGSLNTNADSFSGYGVQLVATKQLDQAKGIMNDFAKDGYSAFVVASEAKGRTLYKVRLGPYLHKPEAVAVQDKVVRRYPNSPYVKSSLVIYKPN